MNATEVQSESWEMSCIKADAQRYCDRHEITDSATYYSVARSMAHRRYMEAIEPLLDMRARILYMNAAIHPVKFIMHKDGRVDHVQEPLSATQAESLRLLDEAIAEEAKKWGFESMEPNSNSKISETDSKAIQMIALGSI